MSKATRKINKHMTIKEVLGIHEATEIILKKHFGHCVGCPSAHFETLALGANLHEKDVKEIVDELNEVLNKSKTKNTPLRQGSAGQAKRKK